MNSYTWTIEKFSEHKEEVSVTSDSFYLDKYQFRLKIYPNGDGVGRYTHLSVFFSLVKGENDDNLQWPFRAAVQLSLLNGQDIVISSDKIKTYPQSQCFMKPVDEKYNVGSGCPKFIQLSKLEEHLTVNDTISIKIEILEMLPPPPEIDVKQLQRDLKKQQLVNLIGQYHDLNLRQLNVISAMRVIINDL